MHLLDGVEITCFPHRLGNYYDVEVRSKEGGDCAFLVSKTPPQGTSSSASWFSDNIFGISGRYGAYGAPQDVRVLRDERDRSLDGGRLLEYSFTALKGNAEVQRRAFVKAVSPPGSRDVVILVAGTTASRWRKENGEKTSRAVVDSLLAVWISNFGRPHVIDTTCFP